jgi:hypothetical protein
MQFKAVKILRSRLVIAAFTVTLLSCASYRGVTLSTLTINSKARNNLIIDRYPEYGDGNPDGCIIMAEMKVQLNITDKGKTINGSVRDVNTGDTLRNVNVLLINTTGLESKLNTDSNGRFSFHSEFKVDTIKIEAIAYRRFLAKL